MNATTFQKFEIGFPDAALSDLRERLQNARRPAQPFATGWSSGTNDLVLWELAQYWREQYDWSAELAKLNNLEQYCGNVGGEQMHFARFGAVGKRQPFPLLLFCMDGPDRLSSFAALHRSSRPPASN